MKAFAVKQIKRFFETGNWALKLIFIVVLAELTFVGGALVGLAGPLDDNDSDCLLYTSPSPRDLSTSRMPSSA